MTRWVINSFAVVMLATALFYLLLEPERQSGAAPAVAVAEGAGEAAAPRANAPAIAVSPMRALRWLPLSAKYPCPTQAFTTPCTSSICQWS